MRFLKYTCGELHKKMVIMLVVKVGELNYIVFYLFRNSTIMQNLMTHFLKSSSYSSNTMIHIRGKINQQILDKMKKLEIKVICGAIWVG